jgi:hypothetical protein
MLLGAVAQDASPAEIIAASGMTRLAPPAIVRGAQAFGLKLHHGKGYSLNDLKNLLDDGQPPIARIKYNHIPDRPNRRYTGAHYVLVVGYDDASGQIFINDPHYPPPASPPQAGGIRGGEGRRRAYSYQTFLTAWAAADNVLLIPSLASAQLAPDAMPSFATGIGEAWVIAPVGLVLRPQRNVPPGAGATGVIFGQHLTLLSPESGPDEKGRTWQQVQTDPGATGWVPASAGGDRYLSPTQPVNPYTLHVLDTSPARDAGGLSVRDTRDINSAMLERVAIGGQVTVYNRVTDASGTPWLWVKSPGGNYGWVREKADGVTLVGTAPSGPPSPTPKTVGPEGFLMTLPQVRQLPLAPPTRLAAPPGAAQAAITTAAIWNKYGGLLDPLAARLGIDPAVAVAVTAAESGGSGMGPDGRMIIRFENHIFWSYWGKDNPDRFNALFRFDADKSWQGHEYRPNPNAPWQSFHGNQAEEWKALGVAQQLNDRAAKLSISMGLAQIMGFNYAGVGYSSVEEMFTAFSQDERAQLIGFFDFVRGGRAASPKVAALQARDFVAFATQYNGPGQASTYASIIQGFCDAFHTLKPAG